MSNSGTTINKKLPKEWEVVTLGDESIADLIMGQSPPSSTYNDKGTGLPFLQGNAEFGETYPTPILLCSQPIKIAEKNDILLSVRAPVGDVNITPSKSCIGRGLAAIRPKRDKLDYLFLFYFLKFGSRKFESLSMGSTFKAIRKEEVKNFQIPLPPLPEQRRIAEVLGTVDSAIQKVGGAIESTERLKKGLMQRLLTRGIGHERFKESEVGRVPEEWAVVSIGDICKVVTGGTPSTMHPEYFGGTIKWLKSGDIKELYIYDTEEKITQWGIENSNAKIHPPGTVAIALSGRGQTRGKTAIIKRPMACSQSVAIMIPNSELVAEYLHYNLSNRYLEIRNLTGHYDRSGLNLAIVGNINILLPPLPEQRRIAEILSAADRKLELERRRKEKLERVKKGMMNYLLTGRKRVKI